MEPIRLYEPVDVPVEAAPGLWIVDGPLIWMDMGLGLKVPFTTRMTIVRLQDGSLWLHSPIRATPELCARVAALGRVAHLVSSNFIHYAGIPGWAAAFPEARAWAAPGVKERAQKHGFEVHFDDELRDEAPAAWAGEIDQHIFAGSSVMREVVFFHRESRTLVLTDLIENFEPDRVAQPWRLLLRAAGAADPDGKAPIDMRATFSDHAAARSSRDRLLAWDPVRVVLAHGRWYTHDGTAELRRAFRWLD